MSAMILVIGVSLQQRMLLAFSLSCFFLFVLPLFTCVESSISGLRSAKNVMDFNFNQTGSTSDSPSVAEITPTSSGRSVKYTNRRLLDGEMCTKFDISIFQGPGSPLPNGIPTFSVQIFNLCTVGCPISNVHVACGWFASAKLVNPKVFRRLKYNDCLVNDGNPIPYGDSITFQYANSFAYQLRVETAVTWLKWRLKSPGNMLSPDEMVQRIRYTNCRIVATNLCSNKDISIFQGRDTSSGIPQCIVQISNTCLSDCAPSDIHVLCGWFASALLVNPNTFRRIGYNDCHVNGDVCTKTLALLKDKMAMWENNPEHCVRIVNTCIICCAPSDIQLYCEWLASSHLPILTSLHELPTTTFALRNGVGL